MTLRTYVLFDLVIILAYGLLISFYDGFDWTMKGILVSGAALLYVQGLLTGFKAGIS